MTSTAPLVQHWSVHSLPTVDVERMAQMLAPVHEQAFGDQAWSAKTLASTLALPTTQLFWIEGAAVIGFALWQVIAPEAELLTLGVTPSQQGRGLAKQLLIESHSKIDPHNTYQFFLEVRADNLVAINLYKKLRYQLFERRTDYYRSATGPCDALLMRRLINSDT